MYIIEYEEEGVKHFIGNVPLKTKDDNIIIDLQHTPTLFNQCPEPEGFTFPNISTSMPIL